MRLVVLVPNPTESTHTNDIISVISHILATNLAQRGWESDDLWLDQPQLPIQRPHDMSHQSQVTPSLLVPRLIIR